MDKLADASMEPGEGGSDDLMEYSVSELRAYDGTGPEGRILIGLNGKVYDVTLNGSHFYKKGGPYGMFAGTDATKGLSSFSMVQKRGTDEGDLTTLEPRHYRNCLHWQKVFSDKYELVGKLKDGGEWDPKTIEAYHRELEEDGANVAASPNFAFLQSTPVPPKIQIEHTTAEEGGSNVNGNNRATANSSGASEEQLSKLSLGGAPNESSKGLAEASSRLTLRKVAAVTRQDMGQVASQMMGQKKRSERSEVLSDEVFLDDKKLSLGLCGSNSAVCNIL